MSANVVMRSIFSHEPSAYARRVVTDAVAARLFASLVADRLAVLGDRSDLEVVSLAVNGERVDVVARSGADEWRVVFGANETGIVEWVDVIARPPVLVPVPGGRAVIVNGPSSSGKSTVLRALRNEGATWVADGRRRRSPSTTDGATTCASTP